MLISPDEGKKKIETLIEHTWKFSHTYTLAVDGGNAEDRESYWYIRDEFGAAVEHFDRPNVRMAPFRSMIVGQMYTLLWLIEDIPCEGWESVTVDYVTGIRDELIRRAKLVPWTDDDLAEDVDYQHEEPSEQYFNVCLVTLSLPVPM